MALLEVTTFSVNDQLLSLYNLIVLSVRVAWASAKAYREPSVKSIRLLISTPSSSVSSSSLSISEGVSRTLVQTLHRCMIVHLWLKIIVTGSISFVAMMELFIRAWQITWLEDLQNIIMEEIRTAIHFYGDLWNWCTPLNFDTSWMQLM